jgi:hypothetical protein
MNSGVGFQDFTFYACFAGYHAGLIKTDDAGWPVEIMKIGDFDQRHRLMRLPLWP